LRVGALCRLPERFAASQWHRAGTRRLQLRGQPWLGIRTARKGSAGSYHIPSSLSLSERDHRSAAVHRRVAALSMGGRQVQGSAVAERCVDLRLLQPPRCLTLPAVIRCPTLASSRSSSGETGSRCAAQALFRHCPRNGKRVVHSRVRRPAWHRLADTFAVGEWSYVRGADSSCPPPAIRPCPVVTAHISLLQLLACVSSGYDQSGGYNERQVSP